MLALRHFINLASDCGNDTVGISLTSPIPQSTGHAENGDQLRGEKVGTWPLRNNGSVMASFLSGGGVGGSGGRLAKNRGGVKEKHHSGSESLICSTIEISHCVST